MRLIDADAICKDCNRTYLGEGYCKYCSIYNMPTIDAVPVVHGHWIDRGACLAEGTVYISYECSVCHDFHFISRTSPQRTPPYCACCGSKMDEEVTE